jgi:hypothetical protein
MQMETAGHGAGEKCNGENVIVSCNQTLGYLRKSPQAESLVKARNNDCNGKVMRTWFQMEYDITVRTWFQMDFIYDVTLFLLRQSII